MGFCWSMILSENRFPLFGIMLYELIEAALITPKATDTKPNQIAEASSPAAIRLERCGSTTCATK